MANKIILKKSAVPAKVPTSGDLEYGELAINYADGKLYYKNTSNIVSVLNEGTGGSSGWVKKTSTYTAAVGDSIVADTSGGSFAITLPSSPSVGDSVTIADGDDWYTSNLTVNRNSSTIEGLSEDFVLDIKGIVVDFIYDGTTWEVFALGGSSTSARGAGGDQVFFENGTSVSTSYNITNGMNAMSAGPITIMDGASVSVPTGSTWTIV